MITRDIHASIESFAKAHLLPPDKIDFDLISYKTIVKLKNGELKNPQSSITAPTVLHNNEPIPLDVWLNPDLEIIQEYDITLKKHETNTKLLLDAAIGANKAMTTAALFVKKESKIVKQDNLADLLKQEINKRKIKARIMIGIFDDCMSSGIEKIATEICTNGKLAQDIKIFLCQCPEFIAGNNDGIRFLFQEKLTKDDAPFLKSSIAAVDMGEVLVEYTKAVKGKSARGINGEFHFAADTEATHMPTFSVGDGVVFEESPAQTIYKSFKSGFVVYDGKMLDIKDELEISKIDFKTGSIDLGMREDGKIEIKTAPQDEDAIAGNMSARAYTIKVSGGIGPDAKVYAHECVIGGQTHSAAKIYATEATIKKHKGYLRAQKAQIQILENGFVSAKDVFVESMLGSTIKADNAKIKTVGSNNSFYIRQSLVIEHPIGENIKVFITPTATAEEQEEFEKIASKLEESRHDIAIKQDKLKADMRLIENNKGAISNLKAKYNPNAPGAKVIADKIKAFGHLMEAAKLLLAEVASLQASINEDEERLRASENNLLNATIIFNTPCKKGAAIKLCTFDPKKSVAFEIQEGSDIKKVWVIKLPDSTYKLQATSKLDA